MKNLLVAQSGGPSAAINATLCGVVEKGLSSPQIEKVYGAKNGIMGILADRLIELNDVLSDPDARQLLCQTPSSALGSCRMKLSHWDEAVYEYEKVISVFRKYNIGYFVYIGGNDSMDTVYKLSEYCRIKGIDDIFIVGAPKTIDNDLIETDHCPGFGSAAKYIGTTFSEIACDCNVYALPAITIVEVMGRDAGWLTAASALGRLNGDPAPDLIYLCERPFSVDQFLRDVRDVLSKKHAVIIAVSEGLKNEDGKYISECLEERSEDAFGHKILAGVARYLEEIVREEIGCKVRSVELNLMQRCASHVAGKRDIDEAKMLGEAAACFALEGGTGKMSAISRVSDSPYKLEVKFVEIDKIANKVKMVPDEWINKEGNDVTEEMMTYLMPLIQGELPCTYKNGVPVHFRLY